MQNWIEATLILPKMPNPDKGETCASANSIATYLSRLEQVKVRLLNEFGGFTVTDGQGVWKNPDTNEVYQESVHIYTIALKQDDVHTIHLMAYQARVWLNQEAVYLSCKEMCRGHVDGPIHN